MFEFINSGSFWIFVTLIVAFNAIKGFLSIYHRESHTGSDILIVVLSISNIGIYIASFILNGWLSAVALFIVGMFVSGSVAADTKYQMYKKTPD